MLDYIPYRYTLEYIPYRYTLDYIPFNHHNYIFFAYLLYCILYLIIFSLYIICYDVWCQYKLIIIVSHISSETFCNMDKCDCVCINQPFSTKVEFSAGAKVVNTLPFYAYISKSENPNNFTVESLNKKLKTSAYSVYKSLFNGVLISEFIKCAICLVYANMVTNNYINFERSKINIKSFDVGLIM